MAMKSIQFDMLNHSNACRCLARAVAELKKKLDLKVDADDAIEEILRWESNLREWDAAKRAEKSTSSNSPGSSHDRTANRNGQSAAVGSPYKEASAGNAHPPSEEPRAELMTKGCMCVCHQFTVLFE